MTRSRRGLFAVALGSIVLVAAATSLFVQLDVADGDVSRSCGSAFDAVAGRSGWEAWWSADVDDPDVELLRTGKCPDAVNGRLWSTGGLLVVAVGLFGASAWLMWPSSSPSQPLDRLGAVSVATGAVLTVGGLLAVLALVADPDSTLFLYVDRLVVALIGLIVLVPAIALMVIGRLIVLVGRRLEPPSEPVR